MKTACRDEKGSLDSLNCLGICFDSLISKSNKQKISCGQPQPRETTKLAFTSTPILKHPDPDKLFNVVVDALDTGVSPAERNSHLQKGTMMWATENCWL